LRQASGGTLSIQDGSHHVDLKMDGNRLREGSISYARQSEVVDLRLSVKAPDGSSAEEVIRFVGQPVNRGVQVETVSQNDELKAEIERLRDEVKRKDAQLRRLRAPARR
jgi:hypothetical protein